MLLDKTPRVLIQELYQTHQSAMEAHKQVVQAIIRGEKDGPAYKQADQACDYYRQQIEQLRTRIKQSG